MFPRQALHAWRIGVTHPITRQRLQFEAPIPADIRALVEAACLDPEQAATAAAAETSVCLPR
jgi:23S rRNA pseudouridine1911/1915/1917 synthase